MPSCVIKWCKNNSAVTKKSDGITFHIKSNVLSKIVIPKLNVTAYYILAELEEKEREEVFRLKRVKQKKDLDKKENEIKRRKEAEEGQEDKITSEVSKLPDTKLEKAKKEDDRSKIVKKEDAK